MLCPEDSISQRCSSFSGLPAFLSSAMFFGLSLGAGQIGSPHFKAMTLSDFQHIDKLYASGLTTAHCKKSFSDKGEEFYYGCKHNYWEGSLRIRVFRKTILVCFPRI